MTRPLLVAAMIVRNEQEHLERCLASISGLCDGVVLVDTGSDDATIEIATGRGITPIIHPWNGDFAEARNVALDAVDADWVLYIDADEEVVSPDPDRAREALHNFPSDVVGATVRFRSRRGFTAYDEHRLWRHRHDIRFHGRIHESHLPDIRRLMSAGMRVDAAPLEIQHHGYEGDLSRKHARNVPLLRAQLEQAPDRVYLWSQLGRALEGLGDEAGAEAAFRHGCQLVERRGLVEEVDALVLGDLALLLRRQRRDASAEISAGLDVAPEHFTLYLAAGDQCFADGDYARAIEWMNRLLAAGAAVDHRSTTLGYDERLFTVWPLVVRGDARLLTGDRTGAVADFQAARSAGADRREMDAKIVAAGGRRE